MIQVISTYLLNRAEPVDKKHHHPSRSATPETKKCTAFHQPMSSFKITDEDDCSDDTTVSTASIKRVEFAPLVRVRSTIGRDSYTAKEIQASWYSAQEVQKIRQENSRTVEKLERRIPLRETKYCARGLEHKMRLAWIARSQTIRQARRCVMEEQRYQILDSNMDETTIASIYHQNTASVQFHANVMGKRDAREIEECMDEDNHMKSN
jgi:hypothetical protein